MNRKNKKNIFLLSLMLLAASAVLFSCSDDDPVRDPENGPSEKPGGPDKIPQEIIDKVDSIYSRTSTGPQEVNTVQQLAALTSICAFLEAEGPISITGATLNKEEITLLTLGGTEEREGQATTMEENRLASFGQPNDYLKAVKNQFENGNIPADKPVLVSGISLGGMIAQQLLGQKEIMDRFKIRAVITFGSPITLPLDRQGIMVIRFADGHDKVPQWGESILRSGMITGKEMSKEELLMKLDTMDMSEKISRTGKYSGMIETHALSYIDDPCWNQTDFMGDPHKRNLLILKEDMKFYPAPKRASAP